jgi:hypothetical protein
MVKVYGLLTESDLIHMHGGLEEYSFVKKIMVHMMSSMDSRPVESHANIIERVKDLETSRIGLGWTIDDRMNRFDEILPDGNLAALPRVLKDNDNEVLYVKDGDISKIRDISRQFRDGKVPEIDDFKREVKTTYWGTVKCYDDVMHLVENENLDVLIVNALCAYDMYVKGYDKVWLETLPTRESLELKEIGHHSICSISYPLVPASKLDLKGRVKYDRMRNDGLGVKRFNTMFNKHLFTESEPDYIGTWYLNLPSAGYFELFIMEPHNGQVRGKVIDTIGDGMFQGTVNDNVMSFTKEYDPENVFGLLGQPIFGELVYAGTKQGSVYRGVYQSVKYAGERFGFMAVPYSPANAQIIIEADDKAELFVAFNLDSC